MSRHNFTAVFLAAKWRAKVEPLMRSPSSAASIATTTASSARARLDRIRAKHPDMALTHGGAIKGED
jgi:hypothetical protein